MKKSVLFAGIAAIVVASCAKDPLSRKDTPKAGMKAYTTTVSSESVKSFLDESRNVIWEEGEKVAVFDGVNSDPNEFEVINVEGSSATIKGQIAEDATTLWGVYPFGAAVSITNDSLAVKIPETQTIASDRNIASNALVSVAKAAVGEELSFKNVASLLKFTLPGNDINKVKFSSLDGATGVAGQFGVSFNEDSSVNIFPGGTTALTVCKEDRFAADTPYYATVFANDVNGIRFVMTAVDENGDALYKVDVNSDKTASFVRARGVNFAFTPEQITSGKFPLFINDKDDLDAFAAHATLYEAGEWVKLCADIDYNATWTAVANFVANFDGGNHSIYGSTKGFKPVANEVYPEFVGMFSKLYCSEVKDLKIGYNPKTGLADDKSDLKYLEKIQYAGCLAGAIVNGRGDGIAKISNFQNYSDHHIYITTPTEKNIYAGNIAGQVSRLGTVIENCTNYGVLGNTSESKDGKVKFKGFYFGGLVGWIGADNVTIEGCESTGQIRCQTKTDKPEGSTSTPPTMDGAGFAGGLVGRMDKVKNLRIIDCNYSGTLIDILCNPKQQLFFGGIIGADNAIPESGLGEDEYSIIIEGCKNLCEGTIDKDKTGIRIGSSTKNDAAGGMIGYAQGKIYLNNCENGSSTKLNAGLIRQSANNNGFAGFGGMIGYSKATGVIKNCSNYGVIAILAQAKGSEDGVGGIVGCINSGALSVSNCKNYGHIYVDAVSQEDYSMGVGGIIGTDSASTAVSGCTNSGNVEKTAECTSKKVYVGKIVGYPTVN